MKYLENQDFVIKYKRINKIYRNLLLQEKAILDKIDMKITINLCSPNQEDIEAINKIYFKYF